MRVDTVIQNSLRNILTSDKEYSEMAREAYILFKYADINGQEELFVCAIQELIGEALAGRTRAQLTEIKSERFSGNI